jgi:hypothetical protein
MLQRVQAEIREVRRLRRAEDSKNAALIMEVIVSIIVFAISIDVASCVERCVQRSRLLLGQLVRRIGRTDHLERAARFVRVVMRAIHGGQSIAPGCGGVHV